MPRVKYACCKHGPWHCMERCGFAHCLKDLSIPTSMKADDRIWRDQTHIRGGHAGIDWFVGQAYSPLQWERLLLYLGSEPVTSMPLWAKRLAWYMEYGNPEDYVSEGDLGWSRDAKMYFDLDVTYEHGMIIHGFPFAPAIDGRGMMLEERIFARMTTGARQYMLYWAKASWKDVDSYNANLTSSVCGKYGRQYLEVNLACLYLRLYISDCAEPWWYMVPIHALSKVLTEGGWAPPTAFQATECTETLYEVPLSELQGVSEPAEETVLMPASGIRVYVDGSTDDGQGIAAGCLIAGEYISSRASLALPGITGSETSELLGIMLGLMQIFRIRESYSMFVLMIDSQRAIEHVFKRMNPVERSGHDLWPCIVLARRIVCVLQGMGVRVLAMKVPSQDNLAHKLANSEMKYRREQGWRSENDHWPHPLCDAFKDVFHCVAANRRSPGIDLPPFSFSKEVLKSLDKLVGGCV